MYAKIVGGIILVTALVLMSAGVITIKYNNDQWQSRYNQCSALGGVLIDSRVMHGCFTLKELELK